MGGGVGRVGRVRLWLLAGCGMLLASAVQAQASEPAAAVQAASSAQCTGSSVTYRAATSSARKVLPAAPGHVQVQVVCGAAEAVALPPSAPASVSPPAAPPSQATPPTPSPPQPVASTPAPPCAWSSPQCLADAAATPLPWLLQLSGLWLRAWPMLIGLLLGLALGLAGLCLMLRSLDLPSSRDGDSSPASEPGFGFRRHWGGLGGESTGWSASARLMQLLVGIGLLLVGVMMTMAIQVPAAVTTSKADAAAAPASATAGKSSH